MKFTIDRRKWRCGGEDPGTRHGTGEVGLLNDDGFMCCLGMICEQAGIPRARLERRAAPQDLRDGAATPVLGLLVDPGTLGVTYVSTDLTDEAIHINDCESYDDKERESALAALFALYGHELEFTGEYA